MQKVLPKTCIHEWVIPLSRNHKEKGFCRLCGEERQFVNTFRPSAYRTVNPSPEVRLARRAERKIEEMVGEIVFSRR